jgi:hypothetical protein
MDERGRTRPLADGGLRDGKRKSGRWERAKIGRAEVGKRRRWDGGKSRRLEKMKKNAVSGKSGSGQTRRDIRHFRDLDVYQLAFGSAMKVYEITKSFPVEERYSLVDQIRRSSRSVCANLAEGWRKRKYEAVFKNKLTDSMPALLNA